MFVQSVVQIGSPIKEEIGYIYYMYIYNYNKLYSVVFCLFVFQSYRYP